MSQLTAPTHTVVDHIPLWLRIREIMKERGSSYSLTAMSSRLGISRETLRLMLSGEREIYNFELEKIAEDLKVPLARLLQEDIESLNSREMIRRFVTQGLWSDALEIARQRQALSLGLSERAESFSAVGYIYTWKKDLEEAKRCYESMLVLAKEIHVKYNRDVLLVKAFQNLLNTCTLMRDADRVEEILEVAEPFFQSRPYDMGSIYLFKARMHIERCERAAAKHSLYKSLEPTLQANEGDEIGRAYYNVAWAEYADCKYWIAKEHLERSIQIAVTDMVRFFSKAKLAKTLFKLNEYDQAISLIQECLAAEQVAKNMELKGKLLILLTRVTRDARHAERVATSLSYPQRVRYLAYRYLAIMSKQTKVSKRTVKTAQKMPNRRFPLDLNF